MLFFRGRIVSEHHTLELTDRAIFCPLPWRLARFETNERYNDAEGTNGSYKAAWGDRGAAAAAAAAAAAKEEKEHQDRLQTGDTLRRWCALRDVWRIIALKSS